MPKGGAEKERDAEIMKEESECWSCLAGRSVDGNDIIAVDYRRMMTILPEFRAQTLNRAKQVSGLDNNREWILFPRWLMQKHER